MKTKINGFEVEGTVSEIRELLSIKNVETNNAPKEKRVYVKSGLYAKVNNNRYSLQRTTNRWSAKEDDLLLHFAPIKSPTQIKNILSRELGVKRTSKSIYSRLWEYKKGFIVNNKRVK